jgi:hypothetical protein
VPRIVGCTAQGFYYFLIDMTYFISSFLNELLLQRVVI